MAQLTLWPLAFINDQWSIPDDVLIHVWGQMVWEGRDKWTMYGGDIQTDADWLEFMHHPNNLPVLVMDGDRPCLIAWLNTIGDGHAFGHFCALGKYRRHSMEKVFEFWDDFRDSDRKPLFHVILGIIPTSNKQACRFVTNILKLKTIGVIPHICRMADDAMADGLFVCRENGVVYGKKQICQGRATTTRSLRDSACLHAKIPVEQHQPCETGLVSTV